MEDAWEELGRAFESSKTKLIGEIDCTSDDAKSICEDVGVEGFPTLKWGHVTDLQEYEGPREFEALKKFADRYLKPVCSVQHIQLCDKATRKEIRRLQKLSLQELDSELFAKTEEYNAIESAHKAFVEGLEEQYATANEEKEAAKKAIVESGLPLMKAVASARNLKIDVSSRGGGGDDEL